MFGVNCTILATLSLYEKLRSHFSSHNLRAFLRKISRFGVLSLLVLSFCLVSMPARVDAAPDTYLLNKVITWADGKSEQVQIDRDGFFFLDGAKRRLVGMEIGMNWPHSSGGNYANQYYLPENMALLEKQLIYLESIGVRFIRANMGYVRPYGLNLTQERAALTAFLDLLYKHKMLVCIFAVNKYRVQFGDLTNPDFSWPTVGGTDSIAAWTGRWTDVASGYPNIVAVNPENELDMKLRSSDFPSYPDAKDQNYTAEAVSNYLTFVMGIIRQKINAPFTHNIVFNQMEPQIKNSCVSLSDIPSFDCYKSSADQLSKDGTTVLPLLGIEGGWWVTELNYGTPVQTSPGVWANRVDVTKFNVSLIEAVFNNGGTVATLFWSIDSRQPNKAFFDNDGNPKPQLVDVASQISRLQAPINIVKFSAASPSSKEYHPAVATVTADKITNNSARLRGNLTSLGTSTSCSVSLLWGTSPDNLTNETTPQTLTATGYYSADLSGLTPDTTYYFKAKAVGGSTVFDNQASFVTKGTVSPAVATVTADKITNNSVRLRGNLTSLGTSTSCSVSFLWGLTPDNLTNETTPQTMAASGYYSTDLSGLTPGTTYYFKAKAVGSGTRLGSQTSFITRP
jgi:hypothetical protein